MKKLIILQGPPASGKSTWVSEFLSTTSAKKTVKVVSRDEIRLRFGEYNHNHENEVSKIEKDEMRTAMKDRVDFVINDATNLNPKTIDMWEKMAKEYGYEIEYEKFYIPFKEAVARDKNEDRNHHVGKTVIKMFYMRYFKEQYEEEIKKTVNHYRLEQDNTLPKAVICDLDGTLAWMQHRSPYDTKTVDTDKIDPQLASLLNILMSAGIYVLFTSGREGTPECREKTLNWLKENLDESAYSHPKFSGNDFRFTLIMRKQKDYRGDEIVKKELFENCIQPYYNVICAFDDRNKVVNMWREIGLLCCQVAEGDF